VRSLALLAALEEKAGKTTAARKLYERYLGYWMDGQIDRKEVARAGQRLAPVRAAARARPDHRTPAVQPDRRGRCRPSRAALRRCRASAVSRRTVSSA
jgi:hypothetical protein